MKGVAIVAQQRTGSSFLSRCLDSHSLVWSPRIELYNRVTWRAFLFGVCQSADLLHDFYTEGRLSSDLIKARPQDFALHNSDGRPTVAPIRVAKIMHNQMLTTPRLSRYIINNIGIHIIHLRRENLLKQHVSNMLNRKSKANRRPVNTTKAIPAAQISINPTHAIYRMRASRALYRWYDKRLSQHPKIEMVYEHMVGENGLSESATELACQFLGIAIEPLVTDFVKLNPDDLRRIIINYDEVAHALAGTEFEQYLD